LLGLNILSTINKKGLFHSMLKIIWIILSLILIGLLFFRTPQNQGLTSFTTKSNLLGSPSSAEQFLNNLTISFILSYLLLAILLNRSS